jgi:hypothetical protein
MIDCSRCKQEEYSYPVSYGELTPLGQAIQIPNCYAENYDEDADDCYCGNLELKEK